MEEHCCKEMKFLLDEEKVDIFYSPVFREYGIGLINSEIAQQRIDFCPWCGTKLPTCLRHEYFDILRNEYGLEVDIFERENIPKEFQTDEWWRKRGL